MKKLTTLLVVAIAVVGLLSPSNIVAQRNCDRKTVETIKGKALAKRGTGCVAVKYQLPSPVLLVNPFSVNLLP
jgi:hypothetical protein